MTEGAPGAGAGIVPRVRGAWHALHGEQRLAAVGALGLIVSMFLPWYQQTGFAVGQGGAEKVEDSLIAFEAWSFVEASILLVALAVLGLLFARAERRAFHLPGGDGLVILGAGLWVMLLVFFRQVDKPSGDESGALKTTVGVSWGIFVAFLFGALIAYAGWRMHARHTPEPPRRPASPGPASPAGAGPAARAATPGTPAPRPGAARPQRRADSRRADGQFEGQLSFEDPDAPAG